MSSMPKAWIKIFKREWILIFVVFSGGFIPGYLYLYLYKYDLFISLETIKLILLSLSISIPLLFLSAVMISMRWNVEDNTSVETNSAMILSIASLFNFGLTLLSIFINRYLYPEGIIFRVLKSEDMQGECREIYIFGCVYVFAFIMTCVFRRINKKKKRKYIMLN